MDLLWLAVILTSLGLIFQLITLTVEFDASKRAKAYLDYNGLVNESEKKGVAKMLNSAAMTYVAGVIATALDLLRLIIVINGRRD